MKHTPYSIPLSLLILVLAIGVAGAEEPFIHGNFKDACAAAGKSKRIVVVDFYTTWCGPCKQLDKTTWKDKKVRAWLAEKAVCVKIDAEQKTDLAKRYTIRSYPTILLLKPDGTEIDRIVGYRDPDQFLAETKDALNGINVVSRAKAKLIGKDEDNPMLRMRYADALAQKGRYSVALSEYLWCLDEGVKHEPAFVGVRGSFLIHYIQNLGRDYPPALEALKQRRDAAHAAFTNGTADVATAWDYAAYNEALGQEERTLTLYDDLIARKSPLAVEMFDRVLDQLLEKKRYKDILAGAGNISGKVEQQFMLYNLTSKQPGLNDEMRGILKSHMAEEPGKYFEALLGNHQEDQAEALRVKILAFDSSASTYVMLVRHAARADSPGMVQSLLAAARTALKAEEYKQVEAASK